VPVTLGPKNIFEIEVTFDSQLDQPSLSQRFEIILEEMARQTFLFPIFYFFS
jgi:hypothetical protein